MREVTLRGEAFFEVTENPHKPFIVKSGNITTTALGTSFNICNFPEDEKITVSLATGKVKVEELNQTSGEEQKPYLLIPGEQIRYSVDAKNFEKLRNEDDEDYLWKDGIISFKQTDLDDVVEKLERWYGVTIDVTNQTNSVVNYDGIFSNQSLDNVLKAMSFSLNFKYSIEQETIKIMFN
jgi:transmembrane sensor